MNKNQESASSIDAYIVTFPAPTQELLQQMRSLIQKAAPSANETISYGMPAFKKNKVLVYFAGYANHIGFYPTPAAIVAFADRLGDYKNSKGAIQFPTDKPLPEKLIKDIVTFRLQQDEAFEAKKKK